MSFLEEIRRSTHDRLPSLPRGCPAAAADPFRFRKALQGRDALAIVAEIKRRSPTRGALRDLPGGELQRRARRYEEGGAAAISVLTEPGRFGGSLHDLEATAAAVTVPVLMKDFLIDPEQVRAGALLGASAVLVIVRLLPGRALSEILAAARELGLDALVECHDEGDLDRAREERAPMIGINNRDLSTLTVDTSTAGRLRGLVPSTAVMVAESGYQDAPSIAPLIGVFDAVLVGSALMGRDDPLPLLQEIRKCSSRSAD